MSNYEDEYADLMEQLQAERPSAPEPNQQFSDGLRGHLLAKYDKQTGWGIGRLTGAATALALFALVVFVGWYLASSQQPSTLVGSGIETTRPAETADSVNELEVTHTTLRVSRVMDEAYTWNVTIEHWQTADGKYTRTMIINEAGELLHFAQSDGTYLWLSKGINAITSQNRRVLDFSQQARVDYVLLDEVPAFFANVGWDNLGQAVIGTDPDCQTDQCKYERLEEPPALGVDPEAFAAGQYGYGVSLIGTEEVNGHVVDVFRFSYKESGSESEETLLPYHRIAKVDAETSAVISITDFNGNKVLRHIERVAQETIMMAANDFKVLPSSAFAALPKRTPQTFAFEDGFQLIGYALLPDQQGDGLQVNVFWQSADEILDSNFSSYGGWIHIVNEHNELNEVFAGLEWEASDEGSIAHMEWVDDLPNGRYQIYAGIYDQDAQENLLTDSGEDVVLLDTIVIEDSTVVEDSTAPTDDVTDSAIPFGDNIIVTYNYYIQEAISDQGDKYSLRFLWYARQTPAERLTAFVHLLDENGQVVQQQDQELAWTVAAGEMVEPGFTEYALQSVEVDLPDGRYQVQVGLYDAVSGQRVTTTQDTVEGETAVWVDEIVVGEGINAVEPAWLEMGRQDGRASSSDTLNVEAVVGYDLSGLAAGEYVLKLHYANPNWESASSGRVPIDGMSDFIPLTEMQGTLTIHFTGNPQEMQSIVGVDEPVLVLMLGKMDGGSFEPYLVETYESFPLLLQETDEATYGFREGNSE